MVHACTRKFVEAFVPKKYKNTDYPLFEKILDIDDRGFITNSVTERVEEAS